MKKNNKGFTLVEIIVTFSMVSTISFLLFQLILSLKNVYTSSDFKTVLLIDQGNITRRINTDLFTMKFKGAAACESKIKDENSKACYLFSLEDPADDSSLVKKLEVFDDKVVYDGFTMDFSKTGSKLGRISTVASYTEDLNMHYNSMLTIDVPITNKIVEGDYGIHITLQYNNITSTVDQGMLDDYNKVEIITTTVRDIVSGITIDGDGLYSVAGQSWWDKDSNYMPRYVFMGTNPNNYVIYSNKCYRIMSISNIYSDLDKTWLKLIYEGDSEDGKCTSTLNSGNVGTDAWGVSSDNNSWLGNNAYLRSLVLPNWFSGLNSNVNRIHLTASPFVGAVKSSTSSIAELINDEMTNDGGTSLPIRSTYIDGNSTVFLPTVSDYVMASLDPTCYSASSAYNSTSCSNSNYLKKSYSYWTVNPVDGTTSKVWVIGSSGSIEETLILTSSVGIRPVIYIKGSSKFGGNGTSANPYVVR